MAVRCLTGPFGPGARRPQALRVWSEWIKAGTVQNGMGPNLAR